MKKILVLFLVSALRMASQTIAPQVINSAGDHRQLGNSGIYITDNVGEPFIQTIGSGNLLITQGFIQPEIISPGKFLYSPIYQSPQCVEAYNDAYISVNISPPPKYTGKYSVKYLWTPAEICPNNDCPKVDTLKPGIYQLTVVVSYSSNIGSVVQDTIQSSSFIIQKSTTPCKIVVYNGVTANNDGINDTWTIDNILDFPNNRVTIYNRWGEQLADIKGYNNSNKVWPTRNELDFLSSTTYFYVIELEPGGAPIKGWVELMKNQ